MFQINRDRELRAHLKNEQKDTLVCGGVPACVCVRVLAGIRSEGNLKGQSLSFALCETSLVCPCVRGDLVDKLPVTLAVSASHLTPGQCDHSHHHSWLFTRVLGTQTQVFTFAVSGLSREPSPPPTSSRGLFVYLMNHQEDLCETDKAELAGRGHPL